MRLTNNGAGVITVFIHGYLIGAAALPAQPAALGSAEVKAASPVL